MMISSFNANGSSSYYQNSHFSLRKNSSCSSSLEEFSTESPFSHESDKNFEKFLNLDEPADSPKHEPNDIHNEKIENVSFSYSSAPLIKQSPANYDICVPQHSANIQVIPQPGIFSAFGVDMRYFPSIRLPYTPIQHSQMPSAGTSSRFGEVRTQEISEHNLTKILEKSKRIMKREKAKSRNLMKQSGQSTQENSKPLAPVPVNTMMNQPLKVIPEIIEEEVLIQAEKNSGPVCNQSEAAALKKQREMMQKIRNRISAQQSRDRRKEYILNLERENQNLRLDNQRLKEKLQKQQQKLSLVSKKGKMESVLPEKGLIADPDHCQLAFNGKENKVILALFTLVSLFFFLHYTHNSIFGKSTGAPSENVSPAPAGDLFIDKPVNIGSNHLELEDISQIKVP